MNPVRLTPQQRFRLRRQLRTTDDLGTYRRTLGLLELDRGNAVTNVLPAGDVARLLRTGHLVAQDPGIQVPDALRAAPFGLLRLRQTPFIRADP